MSFPAYPEYKPSGFDWLPEVPAHWRDRKIARDIPFVVGWTPPSGKDEYYDGDLPWVTIADMTQMSVEDTKSKISHLAVQDKGAKVVPAGSMLFSFKLSVGKIAFLTIDSYTNEAIAGFLPCGPLDLEYWKYAAPEFIPRYGRENIYGATLLNQELISSVRFSAPARAEQTQIARFLDHETARIDALIEEQKSLIELLKEKRQAVISHAVTKGLDPTVPMKDSGVELLGEVPGHWDVVALKRIVEVKDGTHATPNYVDPNPDAFPLITSKDFIGTAIDFDNCKYISREDHVEITRRSDTQSGDVLMSMIGGNIGKALIVETSREFSIKNVALFKSAGNGEKAKQIMFFLESRLFEQQTELISRGGAQGFLGLGDIRSLLIPKPPGGELSEILRYLAVQVPKLDSLIEVSGEAIGLMNERRSALISAAVTGKIDVRGWKPPASAQAPELEVAEAV